MISKGAGTAKSKPKKKFKTVEIKKEAVESYEETHKVTKNVQQKLGSYDG